MHESIIALFIPIITVVTIGLILITAIYFRSRERQMLIEKGLSADQIKEFFQNKRKDNQVLLKIGIICFFFGLGLGIGIMLNSYNDEDYWVPLLLFTMTGIGFVVAHLAARKLERPEQV
jgi:hypothetical protein